MEAKKKMSEAEAMSLLARAEKELDWQSACDVIREMEDPAPATLPSPAPKRVSGVGIEREVMSLLEGVHAEFSVSSQEFRPFDFRRVKVKRLDDKRSCEIVIAGAFSQHGKDQPDQWVVRTRDELSAAVREIKQRLGF